MTITRYSAAAFALILLPLAGCHRATVVAAAPPLPPPVMVSVPPPTHPTEPEPEPEVVETPAAPTPTPPPPRRTPRRRPTPQPVTTPPVTVATNTPPPTVDLGELTTGGESTNAPLRQQTEDLLHTQQRRIITLPSATVSAHSEQIEQARLFLRQADEAWKKQDVEGTRTLATKAKVLLDEIGE